MPKSPKKESKAAATPTSATSADNAKAKAGSPKKKNATAGSKSKSTTSTSTHHTVSDSLDVILPLSLGNPAKSSGECMVLVQIDPEDSAALDFEGSTGAIGRFQIDKQGIILDMKGSQYQGRILPGPTAMIASLCYDEQHKQQLRLETMTDEFCPLVKTQDTMAKLDAQVLKGTLDESYYQQDEDINITAKRQEQLLEQQAKKQQKNAAKATNNKDKNAAANGGSKKQPAKKRAAPKGAASNKKQKISIGKGKK